jgi:lipoprotein-anchoring transpeptidase ErfK/SrfK
MKKIIFLNVLLAVLFFGVPAGLAAETAAEDATDKTLAALEPTKSSAAAEVQKAEADKDAFGEDDFFMKEAEPLPVATVSPSETKETATPAVKEEIATTEVVAPRASSGTPPKKKAVKIQKEPEASSTLNTVDMQKRWKALFSKEITPGSMAYTVKPGDSLYVIARKNHTTVDLIKKINSLKSDNIYPRMKLKLHTAPFSIKIDKAKNTLILYSDGEAVKKYSVATGKKNCTPVGEFKITDKLVNPTWFKTGAILPPGSPKNALGTRWMGFDKPAYGIHGTIEPKSVGTQASEGCVRMLNEEVEELYSLVPVGTKVTIQD